MQSNQKEIRYAIDLMNIPLEALSHRSRILLHTKLNKNRIFTSDEGRFRDWRGVLKEIGIPEQYHTLVASHANPTGHLMELWDKKSIRPPNLAELQTVLALIDRWDIIDDTSKMFHEDAKQFLARNDMDIITKDDTHNHIQHYDAFILYIDRDIVFASETVEHLENSGMRLCLLDRDVLAGRKCEFDELSRLISNRCRRLVLIISQAFLGDPLNSFAAAVTSGWTNEDRERKLIPCLIDTCDVPYYCRLNFVLDYSRHLKDYYFWDNLWYMITDKGCRTANRGIRSMRSQHLPAYDLCYNFAQIE